MKVERLIPILNVSNIEKSFAWFEKLGWKKDWDWGDPPDFGGRVQWRMRDLPLPKRPGISRWPDASTRGRR